MISYILSFFNMQNFGSILLVVVSIFLLIQTGRASHYKDKCESLQREIWTTNSLLEKQNQAIDQWKVQSKAQEANIRSFQIKLKKTSEVNDKKIKELRKYNVPLECNDAIKWSIKQAKEID